MPTQTLRQGFVAVKRTAKERGAQVPGPAPAGQAGAATGSACCAAAAARRLSYVTNAVSCFSAEINSSAVRFAITNGSGVSGAMLVKGHHVRLR